MIKNRLLCAAVLFFHIAIAVKGQSRYMPAPKQNDQMVFAGQDQKIPLEEQEALIGSDISISMFVLGIGRVDRSYVARGPWSYTRIKCHEKLKFIINVPDSVIERKLLMIAKLEQNPNNNSRYIKVGRWSTFSGTHLFPVDTIRFTVKQNEERVYEIEIQPQLIEGEYAIITQWHGKIVLHLFGIDGGPKLSP